MVIMAVTADSRMPRSFAACTVGEDVSPAFCDMRCSPRTMPFFRSYANTSPSVFANRHAVEKAVERTPCATGSSLMSGAHILVVDDDPKVRTLLRRCFEGEGFTVSDAKDGSELRACLERNK